MAGRFLYEIKTYSQEDNRAIFDIEEIKDGLVDSFSVIFYMEMLGRIQGGEFVEVIFSELSIQEINEILESKLSGKFCIRQLRVATTYMRNNEDYLIFRSIASSRAIPMQKRDDGRWEFICGLNKSNEGVKIVEVEKNVFRDLYCVLELTA